MPARRLARLLALSTLLAPAVLAAQDRGARSDADWCRQGWSDDDRRTACEVRTLTLDARPLLRVDGRANGGVEVEGHDGRDIRVEARVQARARSEGDARALLDAVRIASGDVLRAEGPRDLERNTWWSVSYRILVPRRTDLEVEASNGGIAVRGVRGRMQLETTNGGLRLDDLAGDVRARTTNGGVTARLTGSRWDGAGLDVRATNGGVRLTLPDGYGAALEAGTVNGGLTVDFPMTVQGRIGREVRAEIGGGGPPIRAHTTNGGVRIMRP